MQETKMHPSFVTAKGNEIWLLSLPLAWQEFEKETKFTIQIPQHANYQKSYIQGLKNVKCSPNDVDSSVFYKAAGRNQTANKLNKLLETSFPDEKIEKIDSVKHDQIVFYGAMHKRVKLKFPFYNIPGKIMHFSKKKVPCYQPLTPAQRCQVFVIKHRNQDEFMVRIDAVQKNSQVFMYMSDKKVNLEQVLELVRKSNDQVEPMTKEDVFKFPKMSIKSSHIISELSCAKIKFPNENKKYEISQLIQSITFEIEGQAQDDDIDDLTLTVPEEEGPTMKKRRMCLNKPFWIVLRYKDCHPYFVMFMNSPMEP